LGGGQIGCNYQSDWLVLGIEGDGWWSGIKSKEHDVTFPPNPVEGFSQIRNRWDFDVAFRAGIALERSLIYGKAGVVWGRHDLSGTVLDTIGRNVVGTVTLPGMLIGLGLEHALTSNWTAKFEYNYLGFSSKDVRFTCTDIAVAGCTNAYGPSRSFIESVSSDKHVIKVGLNYLFNTGGGPVYTRY
jgi:outer membrane immunogenic protein